MNVSIKRKIRYLLFTGAMMFSLAAGYSQQGTITGTVTDAAGAPIIGANVFIEGTNAGTVTDINGKFTLPGISAGEVTLSVSFIGYLTEDVPVTVTDGGTVQLNITLIEDLQQLSEVVVVGYGTLKKSDLTGSVSSVKPEELTQLSTVSVQQAMQGRVAGVQVLTNTGAPGDGTRVRIRGTGTINNSDPLYVVDGFPVSDINFIAPGDIERMEVLKDASATAIYGNRGANGVVLITTKKGTSQGTKVRLDMYYGTILKPERIPVLDAKGYAEAKYIANDNLAEIRNNPNFILRGDGSAMDSAFQDAIDRNFSGTDWQDYVMRNGSIKNYTLSVDGGSENYRYSVSGGYYREDGVVINSWHRRYLFRYASTFKMTKNIEAEAVASYRNFMQTNYDQDIYGAGVLPPALYGDPISPAFRSDGYYGGVDWSGTTNPIAAADRNKWNRNSGDQIVVNLGLNIDLFKGLSFHSKFGADINYTRPKRYIPVYTIGRKDENGQSQLQDDHQRNFRWNNSNYLNYNANLGKLSLNLVAGQEWAYFNYNRTYLITFDVPDDPNLYFSTASAFLTAPLVNPDPDQNNCYEWETALMSYFGRANISFDNRYIVTATIRRDGTSKMTEENRWGIFPSFSLGWNIKNELFISNAAFISALKLRGGWGSTGNEGSVANPYATYASVSPGLYIIGETGEQLQGQLQTVTPNPNLQWEVVKMWNAAIDFGFMQNKISGSIDAYLKQTEDMIIVVPPPVFQGGDAAEANVASMENKGIELSLNYRNIFGKLKVDVGGNFTLLTHPKITKLAFEGQELKGGQAAKIRQITNTTAGDEMAYFNGFKTDGLLTQEDIDNTTYLDEEGETQYTYEEFYPGAIKLVDLTGDGVIDELDKTNIGSANPDALLGINLNFEYAGFDLKLFFDGILGHEMVNTMNVWLKVPDEGDQNLHEEVLNGWSEDNPNSSIPRLVQGNNIFLKYFNDYLVEDASFFRLKNIQLGYTLPQTLTGKVGIERLRLYVSGENLYTFTKYTGYSPELGYLQFDSEIGRRNPLSQGLDDASYPVSGRYLFGINLYF